MITANKAPSEWWKVSLKDYISKIKLYTALKLYTAHNYILRKEWSITTIGLSFKEEWDTSIM